MKAAINALQRSLETVRTSARQFRENEAHYLNLRDGARVTRLRYEQQAAEFEAAILALGGEVPKEVTPV